MPLAAYRRRRHFSATPEPKGKRARRPAGRRYVMHKHRARTLHYDLRLELDGVLKSWAVPKGPDLDPSHKRLAIQVEDHPVEYGDFEGNIPEGEYGAGTAIVWDRGTWEPLDDPHESLRRGKLSFELHGEKLRGAWALVETHGRSGRAPRQPQWLLVKENDAEARSRGKLNVVEQLPESVASGRTVEEAAAAAPAKKGRRQRATTKPGARYSIAARLREIAGVTRVRMPKRVELQLATLVSQLPANDQWLSEIKLDGYRIACNIAGGKATLLTRRRQDWTDRFADIASAAGKLPVRQAILDGEIVAFLPDGRTSFQALQNALHEDHGARLAYVAFDLLYLDGYDLRGVALEDRKRLLADLLPPGGNPRVQYLEHVVGQADRFYHECCKRKLEGIICKRRAGRYTSGRGRDWLKAKCLLRQEFVIGGYTDSTSKRLPFGALLVGYYDEAGRLTYAGRVGTGWSEQTMAALAARLKPLVEDESPFAPPVPRPAGNTRWVRPRLVADVSFMQWTRDGRLRHPSFQGLREDKRAEEVRREKPAGLEIGADLRTQAPAPPRQPSAVRRTPAAGKRPQAPVAATREKRSAKARSKSNAQARPKTKDLLPKGLERQLKGVRLTNPERILYPEQGLTKLDLAAYYVQVGEAMLPYVVDRPLSIVRCPRGRGAECFFQKHHTGDVAAGLAAVAVREEGESRRYLVVKNLAGLVALVQLGVLEIHVWNSRAGDLERPDQIVFDLDPGAGVPWDAVASAARHVRRLLADTGLKSFLKTTGGKGLHVVAPIRPRASWAEAKAFSRDLAGQLAVAEPSLYTIHPSKSRRHGKIFVDYLRNDRGATSVAPFSTRARPGAPVSVPVAWRELSSDLGSDWFDVENVPARLAALKSDPWVGFVALHQHLPHGGA